MVIFYTTKRWWNFLVSKNNIDKKTIKKEFKGMKIIHQEVCKKKTIDTLFNYWEHNDSKIWVKPYGKCWVDNLDDTHNDRMTREEIKDFIS